MAPVESLERHHNFCFKNNNKILDKRNNVERNSPIVTLSHTVPRQQSQKRDKTYMSVVWSLRSSKCASAQLVCAVAVALV